MLLFFENISFSKTKMSTSEVTFNIPIDPISVTTTKTPLVNFRNDLIEFITTCIVSSVQSKVTVKDSRARETVRPQIRNTKITCPIFLYSIEDQVVPTNATFNDELGVYILNENINDSPSTMDLEKGTIFFPIPNDIILELNQINESELLNFLVSGFKTMCDPNYSWILLSCVSTNLSHLFYRGKRNVHQIPCTGKKITLSLKTLNNLVSNK